MLTLVLTTPPSGPYVNVVYANEPVPTPLPNTACTSKVYIVHQSALVPLKRGDSQGQALSIKEGRQ